MTKELILGECHMLFSYGEDKYKLCLRIDGEILRFVLQQETPHEKDGVIDMDPSGIVEVGINCFIVKYPPGWAPPEYLENVVNLAFQKMYSMSHPK